MNATLYTGTGAATQTVTNGVAGQSFQPDFVWVKRRSATNSHVLQNVVTGFVGTTKLSSNSTDAENSVGGITDPAEGFVSAVSSTGFTVTKNSGTQVNENGATYVGWQWKAGGAAVTNTAGTISSQVSANTTSGFSVVTYTGNGSTGATVGHGLGVTPSMVIVKKRSSTGNWITYHTSTGINQYLYLNSSAASAGATPTWGVSSTTVTFQQPFGDYNDNGATYVAYCFAPVAGYSAFGSYTGNGSTDGPFVYLGFRPRYVMFKRTDTADFWTIYDTSRSPSNIENLALYPNSSNAEATETNNPIDGLSNGFKARGAGTTSIASGGTYIYMAFAESPFRYANAR
jgi:hypothetical protein